jgi:hypothetical protein
VNTLVFLLLAGGSSAALPAQQPPPKPVRPLQTQSPSSLSYSSAPDGSETAEIRNVSYEVTGTQVPGRPPDKSRLLESDIRQKPLYAMTVTGEDGRTLDNALFVASRRLEEVAWWSNLITRYAGLQIPPDDEADARLKKSNVNPKGRHLTGIVTPDCV